MFPINRYQRPYSGKLVLQSPPLVSRTIVHKEESLPVSMHFGLNCSEQAQGAEDDPRLYYSASASNRTMTFKHEQIDDFGVHSMQRCASSRPLKSASLDFRSADHYQLDDAISSMQRPQADAAPFFI